MSKPDHSLDPLILESAKKEFLANGFERASLKEICDRTGVTTGALYKRYKGKDFQHGWVEKMTESTYLYYREAYDRKLCRADISEGEMHILLTAFWATIYEPFIHGFRMEQIEAHSRRFCFAG